MNVVTSGSGTFRTWSDVRLESVVRTEADSAAGYRFALARSAAKGIELQSRRNVFVISA
jgi:hypothetical protein